ncbi:PIN domain-containing protein [Amycolatopsis sp. NPDC049688]|uniref:PIN domain-containing protein n=1 Tax=Amycolatopsis sp. NPDC049688 TaxID=3154733 RepID=UPI003442E67E
MARFCPPFVKGDRGRALRDENKFSGTTCHSSSVLVTPRPGVDRENLLRALQSARDAAFNLQGGGSGSAFDRLIAYLNWASDAVSVLHGQVSDLDLDRLVLTKRYEQLLAGVGNLAGTHTVTVVNLLVSLELKQRVEAFDEAIATLRRHIQRWSQSDLFVVADTGFYINHPVKLEEIDLAEVVDFYSGPIHLLFPMVVVDELDGLKQHKDRHVRWRAGYTLAVLDRLLQDGKEAARLRDADSEIQRTTGVRRGEVNVEILSDPRGHVRLPIDDDEIVDRAAATQTIACPPTIGRKLVLLTYDTGQATRGRRAGLDVRKLSQPLEGDD